MPDPAVRLWLLSRSTKEDEYRCPMRRYLKYHFHGFGITRKAQSLPRVTGQYLHAALRPVMAYVRDHDQIPPDDVVREAVRDAIVRYRKAVDLRGLTGLGADDRVGMIVNEQVSLLEGLVWTYRLDVLPWWHEQYRTVFVEEEQPVVLGCTCGLGDRIGSLADHDGRDCYGVGWQTRGDAIGEKRSSGTHAYLEFKTTGALGEWWGAQWEDKVQFLAGVLGAEAALGQPVDESWVVGLSKGRSEGTYNPETGKKDGEAYQQSVFCYGYYDPSKVPAGEGKWYPRYKYVGGDGKNHNVPKSARRRPVWEIEGVPAPMTPVEYWTNWIGREERVREVQWVGPLFRDAAMLEQFLAELIPSEQGWAEDIQAIEAAIERDGWSAPSTQQTLAAFVQRTWECKRFGKKYECEFHPICFKQALWEDPLASGIYIPRVPHHADELAQARAYGELPPAELMDDVEESEG